jgi:hypothetical protein
MTDCVTLLEKTDTELVATAKEAHAEAEEAESGASPSRWIEADCYAELAKRGWTQQKNRGGVRNHSVHGIQVCLLRKTLFSSE